ncbi:hypothetical protein LCGC14_1715940, partial [marine sediment metagenome]
PQAQGLLQAMIRDKRTNLYEADVVDNAGYYVELDTQAWTNAFHALFGENAVLTDDNEFLYDKLRAVGKDPVVVTHMGLTHLLRASGVPTVDKVLTREQRKWESISQPTAESQKVFDSVWKTLGDAGLHYGTKKPELQMFTEAPGKTSIIFGSYFEGRVSINTIIVGSPKERQACLEELAHHISEASDETREFQTFLLEIADQFMFGPRLVGDALNNRPTFRRDGQQEFGGAG